jgi:hypothetical protein
MFAVFSILTSQDFLNRILFPNDCRGPAAAGGIIKLPPAAFAP